MDHYYCICLDFDIIAEANEVQNFFVFKEWVIHRAHWMTISNIDVEKGGCSAHSVQIYDSGRPQRISPLLRMEICSFFKSSSDRIRFVIMNVNGQRDNHSCGLHAIAFATDLAFNYNPILSQFDDGRMRSHLLICLEKKSMTRFPIRSTTRIPFGRKVLNVINKEVFVFVKCQMTRKRRW